MLTRGKSTDETDVACFLFVSPIHNHNRCFPLGRILLLKPTKEEPKHNDAKTLSLFLYVLQLVSCRPKPRFIFISRKIRAKTERASYQAIDRPSDRSSDSATSFLKLFFHLASHILATLITTRCSERATKRSNKLSHTGRFPLMGWWGIAKRIEYICIDM